jgi:hypothetical protein
MCVTWVDVILQVCRGTQKFENGIFITHDVSAIVPGFVPFLVFTAISKTAHNTT